MTGAGTVAKELCGTPVDADEAAVSHNTAHPSYETIKATRAAYRASAGPRPRPTD